MKRLIIILILILLAVGGCESMKLDGFSVGAAYLNTDITSSQQTTKAEGLIPIGLVNFKFE